MNWGAGNIDEEPRFCAPGSDDFTIANNSPCVGSGLDGANIGAYGIGCNDTYGCTDPYADNYDPDVDFDDGSCAGYPDNGEYVLSFDGSDDYVYLGEDNQFDLVGDFAISALIYITGPIKFILSSVELMKLVK